MKITLISLDNWGFNQHIADAMAEKGHTVHHINFNSFLYKYPSLRYKIYNFFLKIFLRKNLKHIYYGKEILKRLESFGHQDIILTMKGDFIDSESIRAFKKHTDKSIAFFNDNVRRYPNIANVIPFFDEVYSFEKEDCKKYGLKFITNFIYKQEVSNNISFKYHIFNISSKDKRSATIIKIAGQLKEKGILSKIIILDKKNKIKKNDFVDLIRKPIDLDEVNQYIQDSKVLLDIHRSKQSGLSFRVFESLGLHKKLITTNQDVKNYDFYNPNNIYVVENNEFAISEDFFETAYTPIPKEIYEKYTLDGWIKPVFNL